MSYLYRVYFSQLHIIIQNIYSYDSLASQTFTQELVTCGCFACSGNWPSRQVIPWDIDFLLWVIGSSGLEKLVLG